MGTKGACKEARRGSRTCFLIGGLLVSSLRDPFCVWVENIPATQPDSPTFLRNLSLTSPRNFVNMRAAFHSMPLNPISKFRLCKNTI